MISTLRRAREHVATPFARRISANPTATMYKAAERRINDKLICLKSV